MTIQDLLRQLHKDPMKLTVEQLKEICRAYQITFGKKKEEYISRILAFQVTHNLSKCGDDIPEENLTNVAPKKRLPKAESIVDESTSVPVPKVQKPKAKVANILPTVIEKIRQQVPEYTIIKNEVDLYVLELESTSLVFNPAKIVYGTFNPETKAVDPLTPATIDLCKMYKLAYELPLNLRKQILLGVGTQAQEQTTDDLGDVLSETLSELGSEIDYNDE
jgi:hypothetical protein